MTISMFSKPLTKTDIEKRMAFPTKSLRSLPSFMVGGGRRGAVGFDAMDSNGILWRFGCSIRKRGHPKPVLSRDWLAFVRHNKLKIGDKINFYQEIANPLTGESGYKIKVEKAVKVFGAIIGYAPEH